MLMPEACREQPIVCSSWILVLFFRSHKRHTTTDSALPATGTDIAASFPTGSSGPDFAAWKSGGIGHAHPQTGVEPSSLQAHEATPPESEPPHTQAFSGTPGDGSSYQHISWSAMFDHLNNRENGRDWIDKCSITYLGEPFSLAIVLGVVPFQSQPAHMLPEDLEYLRAKGVFSLPEKAHLDALISVFLDHVYPFYPIVNRQEFVQQCKNDHLSLILTYAISFIAVTFASQSVLSLLGFHSRHEARSFFYKKAKALFDMGYETNKITILQSTFFLSSYGGAIGTHRSTIAVTNMQPQDKSLMRRLWWASVVRDGICGTLVGRPFRIDLDQADADMLTIEDFAHDAMAPDFLENPSAHRYAQYQIKTAKLSQIMREIIISRFYPGRQPVNTLTWDEEVPDPSNPFSTSLYMSPRRARDRYIIDSAAQHIPTIVCTLVTKSALLTVPHELYHGIFLARAAFYEQMRSPNKLVARLGRSALSSCQMVSQAISEFWDCGTFILQLFKNLSSRCLEQQSWTAESGREGRVVGSAEACGIGGAINSASEAGVFNALLGNDRWQGNFMLESLFDLPPELFLPE
ncbi:hypothetical protein BDW72DRAFT_215088 [Aspergillus terricola var. indicus]